MPSTPRCSCWCRSEQNRHMRDDPSVQLGTHALKLGASYNRDPSIGILNTHSAFGSLTFFDDPSVILSNSNGRYPNGLQTPGIVRQWAQGAPDPADAHVEGVQQFMTWFQDDWRVTPRLTLDMGVRYDLDINFYGQRQNPMNAT